MSNYNIRDYNRMNYKYSDPNFKFSAYVIDKEGNKRKIAGSSSNNIINKERNQSVRDRYV